LAKSKLNPKHPLNPKNIENYQKNIQKKKMENQNKEILFDSINKICPTFLSFIVDVSGFNKKTMVSTTKRSFVILLICFCFFFIFAVYRLFTLFSP
jgi:uncharacterized membrane protein